MRKRSPAKNTLSLLAAAALSDQTQINREAAELSVAALYQGHRTRLTAAIADLAQPSSPPSTSPPSSSSANPTRLCLLGAGNCADVDLATLARLFDEIHLVDVDAAALQRASARQEPTVQAKLHLHGSLDLSGLLRARDGDSNSNDSGSSNGSSSPLNRWRHTAPADTDLETQVQATVASTRAAISQSFDVVVSCCLATQMSRLTTQLVGIDDPLLPVLREYLATVHLRTMAALTAVNGRALFATDVVSNETYPLDFLSPTDDLSRVLDRVVSDGNVLSGGDPRLYGRIARHDLTLSQQLRGPERLAPWLWQLGEERVFLVYAWIFTRVA